VTTANGQSGTATITVTVSDGWLSTSSTFVLTVNSAPTISDITAQSINQGSSTSALAFTVGDAQTAAGSLNVSASSSNTTLVPTSNIVFGGSGANRTVTVTPASGQSGTATITVTVSDGSLSTSDTFVLAVNAPPTISEIYTREINVNEITGALEFTINDDQTAVTSLTVSGNSSNTTLVPNANIVFGGSGANRTVTVTPASGQTGSATITVTVSDGSLSGSDTFLLKINPVAAMVLIPAGPFTMGDSAGDYDGDAPTHTVALDSFYIGNFEVTKAEWDEVRTWAVSRGYTDLAVGGGKASNHPVHSISWHDMVKWCNARSVKEGLTPVYYTDYAQTIIYHYSEINLTNVHVKWSANGYRLPTEAEWEKAARGGLAGKRFPWGDTISHSQANYQASSNLIYDMSGFVNTYKLIGTSPAGDLEANGYGLYDMSGNLWEMCWDRYGSYAEGIQTNPHGVDSGSSRVRRGGSWYYFANVSRNASRSYQPPTWSDYDVGFRIARNLEANEENTYPTISDIVAQRISSVSNTGALTFSISDAQTEASTLTVSGSSSNTTLISDSNIVFGGSGANRTVTVTPTSGQTGTATITVTVSDGSLSSSDTFALTVTNDNTPDMAHIPAGQFDIGNTAGYINGISLDAYFIGKYEVTKAEWDEVRTWAVSNGYTDLAVGGGKASNHPVHSISWYDMVKWCNARSQKEGLSPVYWVSGTVMRTGATAPTATWSANGYRLPTEAEWEKAARGGLAGKRFPWGDTISHSQANYQASTSYNYDLSGSTNSYHPTYKTGNQPYTSPVGSFAANGYGLYDMSGNLWEMCWNWWGTYTGSGGDPVNNPRGPLEPLTSDKVCRGGDWFAAPVSCQVTHRGMTNPSNSSIYTGFRIARSSVP
jgi:formylglycine-generating enzyme required for sulfatase activity